MNAPAPAPGWYPDPQDAAAQRWWDGRSWTEHVAAGDAPMLARQESRNWAIAAHLSALAAMVVAMAFLGPLTVYLVKGDDPFVRDHAREALNFQLSVLLYAVISFFALFFVIGFVFFPILAVLWLTCIVLGAIAAGRGEAYRYPLTIRFVRG